MKKLVLIDSNAIIHRAYHALPVNMKNSKGELTNAVYGFTTTLIKVLEDLKPDYIAASFDVSKKTFRTEHYAEYKANRVKADQELYDQIPRVRQLLDVLGIPIYEKEGFEADDVIGTIVQKTQGSRVKGLGTSNLYPKPSTLHTYIVTGDKDLFQLIDGNIFVYSLRRGLSDMAVVDREFIKKEYDLDPEDFIDLKALAGDPSDNIPGVPNIGKVTATKLIQQFDTLENLYDQIEAVIPTNVEESSNKRSLDSQASLARDDKLNDVSKKLNIKSRILQLLIDNKEQAFMSQKLATIHKEVPIDFDLEKCRFGEYDKDKLEEFFEQMQFRSLLRRFGAKPKGESKTEQAKVQQKKDEQLKLL